MRLGHIRDAGSGYSRTSNLRVFICRLNTNLETPSRLDAFCLFPPARARASKMRFRRTSVTTCTNDGLGGKWTVQDPSDTADASHSRKSNFRSGPSERITALSRTFRSSLTFPGHLYAQSFAMSSAEMEGTRGAEALDPIEK